MMTLLSSRTDSGSVFRRRHVFCLAAFRLEAPTHQVGDVIGAQHHDGDAQVAENDRADGGEEVAEGGWQLGKGQRQQRGNDQPDDQPDAAGHQLLHRELTDDPSHRTRRLGGEIRSYDCANDREDERKGYCPLQRIDRQFSGTGDLCTNIPANKSENEEQDNTKNTIGRHMCLPPV